MGDSLSKIWRLQAAQQAELGLDPRHMNDVVRRDVSADLILNLYEEVTAVQAVTTHYKRHLLTPPEHNGNVAEKVVDILKLSIALAQTHGVSPETIVKEFERKTKVVRARAEQQRLEFESGTKVVCVDLDDVVCDLTPWVQELEKLKGNAPNNSRTLQMMEAWKDDWYKEGRFCELLPVIGAVEALNEIRDLGFKIVVITARPQWQYRRIYADTLEWLAKYGIPHDLILFNKDKVESVFTHLTPAWPLVFVEDHPRNAMQLGAAGIPVLFFTTPRNLDFDEATMENVVRVHNWGDVLGHIRSQLDHS